jgi:hypothetical protein
MQHLRGRINFVEKGGFQVFLATREEGGEKGVG